MEVTCLETAMGTCGTAHSKHKCMESGFSHSAACVKPHQVLYIVSLGQLSSGVMLIRF